MTRISRQHEQYSGRQQSHRHRDLGQPVTNLRRHRKSATATTAPTGLTVNLTYNGSPNAPINVGSCAVVGIVNDPNYQGGATNTLVIVNPGPAPVITSMNPSRVEPGG